MASTTSLSAPAPWFKHCQPPATGSNKDNS
jgi:hypothetical protein